MVYHRRSWKVFWILMGYGKGQFWRLDELVAEHSEAQTGCPVTYTYTRDEGRQLIESSGFRVTDVFVDHIFPYRIPEYVKYEYVKSWPWSWTPPVAVSLDGAALRLAPVPDCGGRLSDACPKSLRHRPGKAGLAAGRVPRCQGLDR